MKRLDINDIDMVREYLDNWAEPHHCYNIAYIFCNNFGDTELYYDIFMDCLRIFCKVKKKQFLFVCPISGTITSIIESTKQAFDDDKIKYCQFFPVEYVHRLGPGYSSGFECTERINLSKELINYPGKRLASHRYNLNYFKRTYNPVVKPYHEDMYEDCMRVSSRWAQSFKEKNPHIPIVDRDYEQGLFHYHKALGISIITVHVKGELVGYGAGIRLNEEIYAPLIEKYIKDFRGLRQFIAAELALLFSSHHYFNTGHAAFNKNLERDKSRFTVSRELTTCTICKDRTHA